MTNQKKRCMTASYSSHINNSPDVLMSSPFSRLLVDEGDHVSLDTAVDGIIWVAHVIQRRCHSSSLVLTIKSAPHVYIYKTSQCVKILSFSGDSRDACPTVSPLGACKTTVSAIKLGTTRKLKIQCVCVCVVKRFRVTLGDVWVKRSANYILFLFFRIEAKPSDFDQCLRCISGQLPLAGEPHTRIN